MKNLRSARNRYLGTRDNFRCVDGQYRLLVIIEVEDGGEPGSWYLTGRDSDGFRHSAYTDRQQG